MTTFKRTLTSLLAVSVAVGATGVGAQESGRGRKAKPRDLAAAASHASANDALKTLGSLRSKYPGLGALVPIATIKKKLEEKIAKGELPAGEKVPDDLAEWKCPAAKPGVGTSGDCVNPVQKYECLLPGVNAYIDYIWVRVDTIKDKSAEDAVAVLYNFGCREISRHMPGYARITKVTVKAESGVQTTGDWDAQIGDVEGALGTSKTKRNDPKGKGAKYQGPPKKDEVVEVCMVTHLQLEETLKKDLALLVKNRARGSVGDDPKVIQGKTNVFEESARKAAESVRSKLKLADGKGVDAERALDVGAACRDANAKHVAGTLECETTAGDVDADFDAACGKQHGEKLGVRMSAAVDESAKRVTCRVRADQVAFIVAEELLRQDLGDIVKDQPHLKGETFRVIAGRLSGFFRKAGKARVFEEVSKSEKGKVRLDNAPKELKEDVDNQNASAPKQVDRESLRLKVDQWTDAWEYRETTKYLSAGAGWKQANDLYKEAEKVELTRFWSNCNEIGDLCEKPSLDVERAACVRCAYKTLFAHCIDGREKGGRCTDKPSLSPPDSSEKDEGKDGKKKSKEEKVEDRIEKKLAKSLNGLTVKDSNLPDGGAAFPYKSGNTVYNWIVLRTMADVHFYDLMRGSEMTSEASIREKVVRSVALRWFLPFALGQSGKRLSNEGKKAFDQMPLSRWQKCYLWSGGTDGKCDLFDEAKPKKAESKVRKWAGTDRAKSPLFRVVLADGRLDEEIKNAAAGWKRACDKTPKAPHLPGTSKDALPIGGCKAVEKHSSKWKSWCAKKKPRPVIPPHELPPPPGCERIAERVAAWDKICEQKDAAGTAGKLIVDCKVIAKNAERAWDKLIEKGAKEIADESGGGSRSSDVGGAVAGGVSSVVGTILGIILKATGLEDMMKTLAMASGISPEQTVDCEDPEYRKETMGLAGAEDNKLACIGKVFAKNFGTVLESIIVMLGKKLVDWVMKLLNSTLGKAKQALLTAAGSVPYVGGVLVVVVEVAWWLVFDFGVNALLKGVVIANLPKWLKIKELATLGLNKLTEHPIVAVIMGFILNMIQSAAAHGNKNPAEIAFSLALEGIQLALQAIKPPPVFWIRALAFAKKELLKHAGGGDRSIGEQIKLLVVAMIEGFKMALSARLDEDARKDFEAGVDELKAMIEKGGALKAEILKNPVGFIVDLVATKLFPIAIPIITSFVKMPELARSILNAISRGIKDVVAGIRGGKLDGRAVMGHIARIAEAVVELVIDKLPIASDELKTFFKEAVGAIAWVFQNIDEALKSLKDPWAVVSAIIVRIRPVVKMLAAQVQAATGLSAESRFLEGAVTAFLDALASADARKQMFGDGGVKPPEPRVVFAKLADVVRPYLVERLGDIARPLGLQKAVDVAVGALLGPDGLLAKGESFLQGVPAWLKQNGEAALATVADVAIDFFGSRVGDGAGVVIATVRGVIGAVRDAFKKPGGLAALAKEGAATVLKLAREALKPFVDAVIAGLGSASPLAADAKSVLGELLRFFENPADLVRQGSKGAWTAFVSKTGENIRAIFKAMVGRLVPTAEVQSMSAKVVLDEAAYVTAIGFVIEKVVGGGSLASTLKGIVEAAVGAVAKADSLKQMLSGAANAVLAKLIPVAKNLITGLMDSLVRDSNVRKLADAVVGGIFAVIEKGFAGGADGLAIQVRDSLSQVIASFADFLKTNMGAVLPERLGTVRSLILRGFDTLVTLARNALTKPDEVRKTLADGKQLAGSLVDGAVDIVKGFVEQAITNKPARTFVAGLFDALGAIARNVQAMAEAARGGKPSAETILPLVGKVAETFLNSVLVDPMKPGPGRKVVEFLVKRLADALKDPAALIAFVERVAKSDKSNAKEMLRTVARDVIGMLLDELKRKVPTLADILKKAIEFATSGDRLWSAPEATR